MNAPSTPWRQVSAILPATDRGTISCPIPLVKSCLGSHRRIDRAYSNIARIHKTPLGAATGYLSGHANCSRESHPAHAEALVLYCDSKGASVSDAAPSINSAPCFPFRYSQYSRGKSAHFPRRYSHTARTVSNYRDWTRFKSIARSCRNFLNPVLRMLNGTKYDFRSFDSASVATGAPIACQLPVIAMAHRSRKLRQENAKRLGFTHDDQDSELPAMRPACGVVCKIPLSTILLGTVQAQRLGRVGDRALPSARHSTAATRHGARFFQSRIAMARKMFQAAISELPKWPLM